MSNDEKMTLPDNLKMRNGGGMYFPKLELISFVLIVNLAMVCYACNEAMGKHGSELLKVSC